MCKPLIAYLLLALSTASMAQVASTGELAFSGYYKNLLTASRTVLGEERSFALDLNRLRLELAGNLTEAIAIDLQYDNELRMGSYVRTTQFRVLEALPDPGYWDLERTYARGDSYIAGHRLYRASATLSQGPFDVRLGRQRIAWGTGRFWSPTDLLNPFSPVRIERDERQGVDALLAEYKLGALSRVSAVYAPSTALGPSSSALRWHGNIAATDWSVLAGRFRGERVLGADVASQIGTAGVRGEITYTARPDGDAFWRALVGLDYALPTTLTLTVDLYYNGAGATQVHGYDVAALVTGRVQSLARPYVGGYVGYEITPLLKTANYIVVNLLDGSVVVSPTLTYSVATNLDVACGMQLFRGGGMSEYGRLADLYFAQLQYFF